MLSRSPTRAFINVDLPTLGFPIILMNPALCGLLDIVKINGQRYLFRMEMSHTFVAHFGNRLKMFISRDGAVGSSLGS